MKRFLLTAALLVTAPLFARADYVVWAKTKTGSWYNAGANADRASAQRFADGLSRSGTPTVVRDRNDGPPADERKPQESPDAKPIAKPGTNAEKPASPVTGGTLVIDPAAFVGGWWVMDMMGARVKEEGGFRKYRLTVTEVADGKVKFKIDKGPLVNGVHDPKANTITINIDGMKVVVKVEKKGDKLILQGSAAADTPAKLLQANGTWVGVPE